MTWQVSSCMCVEQGVGGLRTHPPGCTDGATRHAPLAPLQLVPAAVSIARLRSRTSRIRSRSGRSCALAPPPPPVGTAPALPSRKR
eukprot:365273-Chlamydomonas_euryale.AAC.5